MRLRTLAIAGGFALAVLTASILIFGKRTPHEEITCPSVPERNRIVLAGLTSSARSEDILQDRLQVIRRRLAEGGVCGGPTVVQAWATSGTAATLWNAGDKLDLSGGTEKARDNRIATAVDKAMDERVVPKFRQAMKDLPANQSDFTNWIPLAADVIQQLKRDGNTRPTDVWVLDDGVQIDDQINLNRPITVDDATLLAKNVPVRADLTGVNVYLVGIGHVAGPPPPAGGAWTDAVRLFAKTTCDATKASCTPLNSSVDQPTT